MVMNTIKFLSIRKSTTIMSIILIVISGFSLMTKGLNLGIDFTGGIQIEISFETAPDIKNVRNNSKIVRNSLTRETWQSINECWIKFDKVSKNKIHFQKIPEVLENLLKDYLIFRGTVYSTLLRNDVYYFLEIGMQIFLSHFEFVLLQLKTSYHLFRIFHQF